MDGAFDVSNGMTAMLNSGWRTTALGLSVGLALVLAGCEGPPASESAPPPGPMAESAPPPAPDLAGGPPASTPAPPPGDVTQTARMDPIPNPEDMTPAERARIYGGHYAWPRHHHHPGWRAGARQVSIHRTVAAAPLMPAVKAAAPVAVATPAPAAQAPATAVQTPIQKLQTAVSGVGKTAVLAVPSDLSAAKPGQVTVSLPPNLFSAIRAEAAKLGLVKAARKAEVTATLSGDGYVITPNGPQTAPLKAGKPTVFTWQVLPEASAKGALKADVSAVLKGAGAAESIAIAHLEQTVASVEAAVAAQNAKAAAGKAPSNWVIGGVIGAIALLILLFAGRAASNRREIENRRRRARAQAAAAASAEPVIASAPAETPVVEPVVEAAHAEPEAEAAPVVETHAEAAPAEAGADVDEFDFEHEHEPA